MAPDSPDARVAVDLDGPFVARHSLLGSGAAMDPTYLARPDSVRFASRTPQGPATVRAQVDGGALVIDAWGAGAGWMTDRADALAAVDDDPRTVRFDHEQLDELNRRNPGMRHGAHGCVVDNLLARVLGQRVLAVEAGRSWIAICRELGDPAPGPFDLQLAPDPERVANTPTWWFHQHGVERQRAQILVTVARNARRLAEVVDLPLPDAYRRMRAVRGWAHGP